MSIRVQKTFEALFELEEIRGIFRDALPSGFSAEEEAAFQKKIQTLRRLSQILKPIPERQK